MSNNEPKFGKLKEMSMREIWRHEARKFTPWLADNIAVLGDALGLSLRVKQTEAPIGGFSLDVLAEEEDTGRTVAIENQFRQTDHSHLGQLLTYAAGCDADIVIWIMEEARDEHRAAVEWLNRKTDTKTHFYLVAVKVFRIDESAPVFQFIPVVESNEWQKARRSAVTTSTSGAAVNTSYFPQFINELRESKRFSYKLARRFRPATAYRFYNIDVTNLVYCHEFRGGNAYVYLCARHQNSAEARVNENFYRLLSNKKEQINKKIAEICWEFSELPNNWRTWYIGVSCQGSLSDSEESLAKVREWAVNNMLKLADAIPPDMLKKIADELEKENGGE